MAQKSTPLDLPTFKHSKTAQQPVSVSPHTQTTQPISPPMPMAKQAEKAALPLLPKTKRPNFSSHRNHANAALALDLLADVENAISGWHRDLRQTLLNIQELYMAGPIVDGWLEAVPNQGKPSAMGEEAKVLRHGDAYQIAAYVDKLSRTSKIDTTGRDVQYRLCSLDTDGQVQCQACPLEQLGAVSQAIARHQQLRQLLNRKQSLESRLTQAADALKTTRQALGITGKAAGEGEMGG